jgi:tetratricopeptide (TPR) repeat protein
MRLLTALIALLAVLIIACENRPPGAGVAELQDSYGETLGTVNFPVSCSEEAQPHIRRGLALLHHMTYMGAEPYFATARRVDPKCAMAYWGVAMTYLHPLWPDVPSDQQFERAQQLIQQAESIDKKTEREAAYITALKAYYVDGLNRTEQERLASFKTGWSHVYRAYPNDLEAAAFYALALMATAQPGEAGLDIKAEAGAIAEGVLAKQPDHPGAHHYIIHAYDTPDFAQQALAVARAYGDVAPDVPHALHMPTHIFTRLGLWRESIEWNRRSADAALKGINKDTVSSEYLHALDYLAYAYLQTARDEKAKALRDIVLALEGPYGEMSQPVIAYALAAIPARYALERWQWAEGAALEPRQPNSFPWAAAFAPHEALTYYAKGIGAARSGDAKTARAAMDRLQALREQVAQTNSNAYWANQIEIQHKSVAAWIVLRDGNADTALELMQQAVDLESRTDKAPVTPGEILPARELLGDLLLELSFPEQALSAYEAALLRSPNRFNSVYGAAVAAESANDAERAAQHYQALVDMCSSADSDRPRLTQARAFLDRRSGAI